MSSVRLTMGQALLRFLAVQEVERDGVRNRFFGGCFGIFGHGNVAGFGQALAERPDLLRFVPARNEQAMVHAATAYARMRNRLGVFVCTSSIGPGATNMVTGAACATINRLPVLLLPGDVFASRRPDPVLQQLEVPWRGEASVNDCFQPVSRYWDRIVRPEQLVSAALAAMRVLTSQAETGAVTLALPQDVQAEAYDYPADFLEPRVWLVPRPVPEPAALSRALQMIRSSKRPFIVAGGGVIYSEATAVLARLCQATGIPVGETQAGKGSLPFDHPCSAGAVGTSGALAANRLAAEADLVIGIGTRWGDFTTASKTAFKMPGVRFINVNVADFDAGKHAGFRLVGDARVVLEALEAGLSGWSVEPDYRALCSRLRAEWEAEVDRLYHLGHGPLLAQSEVLGTVNELSAPRDVVVCAAGSIPGDLHKLWRTRDPKGYHVEYGYSTMGYEVAGGLGVKMADPTREVYVLVGDGSYLMMAQEIVTSLQEGLKLTVVLVDNHGYSSIGGLSRGLGCGGFGTQLLGRDGSPLPVDLAKTAEGLGAHVFRVRNVEELRDALLAARGLERTAVIYVQVDGEVGVPSYDSWWDVPVAEVSETATVAEARRAYEEAGRARRWYLRP